MYHRFLFLIIFSAAIFSVKGQIHEFGVIAGPMGYSGDLANFGNSLFKVGGKANDKFLAFDNLGINAFYKYNFDEKSTSFFVRNAGIRANLLYGKLSGGAVGPGERFSNIRDLHFFTNVFELSAVYELNFFKFQIAKKQHFALYVFGGLGAMSYNPKAYLPGDNNDSEPQKLKDYPTEGVDRKSTLAYTIPMGGGIKWKPEGARNPWTFGLEISGRITTDNLDDVHQAYPAYLANPASSTDEFAPRFLANPKASDPMQAQSVAGYARGNQYLFDMYKLVGVRVSYTLFRCDCPSW
ncbi:hypothetical protein SAMN05216436_10567 [bacterium A37T11]|nr:hypothetical protein SAMN05216436_10567 [bacterium A37T11]